MEISPFEKDLVALLKKHKKIIFAAPCYKQGTDGAWHPDAELKWADAAAPVKEAAKTDLNVTKV